MIELIHTLYVGLQPLLPARLMGRLVRALSRCRVRWIKNGLILGFSRLYGVDSDESLQPVPEGFAHFNAFFTRKLKPGLRPIAAEAGAICAPADGRVQQLGELAGDSLLQAKGMQYRLARLFGDDQAAAELYRGGAFLTIYLAPYNYHRVHMPLDGILKKVLYVPGRRLAVNRITAQRVPGLFAENERLVCHFANSAVAFAVVLVGAMNVAGITTAWAGEVMPRRDRAMRLWEYADDTVRLSKGDYLGQFDLGSTVILTLPAKTVTWEPALVPDVPIRMGQSVGILSAP